MKKPIHLTQWDSNKAMLRQNLDFDEKRRHDNEQILQLLDEYLQREGRELRFNQLMYMLNGTEDYFHEEPAETLARYRATLKLSQKQ